MQLITKSDNHVALKSELFITNMITDRIIDNIKSYYQLIIKVSISKKEE